MVEQMSGICPLISGRSDPERNLSRKMGQATRTIKLPLALDKRRQGGANTGKRAYLEATVVGLNAARVFYIAFFLAPRDTLTERVPDYSEHGHGMPRRAISADKLLHLAEVVALEIQP